MIKISKKAQYGLRAVICLFNNKGPLTVSHVSRIEDIPVSFLEKIFLRLRRAGLLSSKKGPGGGYYPALAAGKITVFDIISALEKKSTLVPCLQDNTTCPRQDFCFSKNAWVKIQSVLLQSAKGIKLSDLIDD